MNASLTEERKRKKLKLIRLRKAYKYRIKYEVFKKFGYIPHDAQRIVHDCKNKFVICVGGARFGKTMAGAAEAALQFLIPGSLVWIIGTVYDLAEKEFSFTLEYLSRYEVSPGVSALSVCRVINPNKGSKKIIAPWGSTIVTKSTEKPSTLLGDEIDLGIGAEWSQATRTPWERCIRARLGPREGEFYALSTGNGDVGLFADQFRMGDINSPLYNPNYQSFQFSVLDNPFFDRAEYERAKIELDPKVFAEQYEGKLVSRLGRVFEVPVESKLYKKPPRLDTWPIMFGLWGNLNNPSCVASIAVNPEGHEYVIYDQFYEKHARTRAIYDYILKMSEGRNVIGVVGNERNTYIIEEMKKYGLFVVEQSERPLSKEEAESARIQMMWRMLEGDDPVLKFMPECCPDIVGEFEEATWAEGRNEKNRLNIELPLDLNMTSPRAVSCAIGWCELGRGNNFYEDFANLD